jgi:hypothetical protein
MFDLPSSREKYPEYAAAGQKAFETLLSYIFAGQEAGALPAEEPQLLALTAWSMMHGIAKLAISQRLPFRRAAVRDFADRAARMLLSGMAGAQKEHEPKAVAVGPQKTQPAMSSSLSVRRPPMRVNLTAARRRRKRTQPRVERSGTLGISN